MEDNSFISGLSSIGDAIGESSYGRCITLWITQCKPHHHELAVRLGGPGSLWHTVAMPMSQPLTIHRPASARVLRRATELAIATTTYVESTDAESEEVRRSSEVVILDVLTNMASTLAGTTISTAASDTSETELTAARVADSAEEEAEAHHPLNVRFLWAIGEILPGAPLSAEAAAEAKEGLIKVSSRNSAANSAEKEEEEEGEAEQHHPPHTVAFDEVNHLPANTTIEPHTPMTGALGDEDSTPNSSGKLSSLSSPPPSAPPPAAADAPSLATAQNGAAGGAAAEEHRSTTIGSSNSATARPISGAELHAGDHHHHDDDHDDESGEEDKASHPLSTERKSPHDAAEEEKANHDDVVEKERDADAHPRLTESPVTSLPAPLALQNGLHLPAHGDTRDVVAVSFNDSSAPTQHRDHNAASMSGGGFSSSSRSNTPRRQRPRSARRSTVQMDLAPVMEDALEAQKKAEPETDDSVHISDDDEDDDGMPRHAMHHPPPPPPPAAAQPFAGSAQQGHPGGAAAPSHGIHFAPGSAAENAETTDYRQAFGGHSSDIRSAPPAVVPAKPRSSAENLFEGAAADDVIVSVAVVAVYNTKGAADPHRVVSVRLDATAGADVEAVGKPGSAGAAVYFQTAPTLRSLAAVAPQMSAPTLLRSALLHHDGDGPADSHATQLHAACTVQESVANTSTSTVLWTARAEVDTSDTLSPSSSPVTQEVIFDGSNGDVVVTRWTCLTVGAYRDAALNLRCRADEPGRPTLQVLLVEKEKSSEKTRKNTGTPAHVWVCAPSSHADAVQHRLAAAAPTHALVHQPVQATMQDPLAYVAVHVETPGKHRSHHKPSPRACHVEALFFHAFSDEWRRAAAIQNAQVDVYYRIVAPASSVALPALAPQLPKPFSTHAQKTAASRSEGEETALRELVITVKPPTSLLTSVFTTASSASVEATPSAAPPLSTEAAATTAPSSWILVLRHAVTHAILAASPLPSSSSAPAAAALTYRCFLPLTLHEAARRQTFLPSFAESEDEADALSCLPWELLLLPAAPLQQGSNGLPHQPTPPNRSGRRNSRSALHGAMSSGGAAARKVSAEVNASTAWAGALMISHAELYRAGAARCLHSLLCVSAPSTQTASTSSLQSAAAPLGAVVEVHCDVRQYSLDAQAAVFCLRSLRLISSPVTASGSTHGHAEVSSDAPLPPAHVRLWFGASGSSAEELTEAWKTSHVPTVKEVQRAWAPDGSSADAASASPLLHTDPRGRLVSTGAPVLLSTMNNHARLCVAVMPDNVAAGAEGGSASLHRGHSTAAAANESRLRRCVTAVRKRAIHRYAKSKPAEDADAESDAEAVAAMYLRCIDAVAMRVDNYAEVDLAPSLAASSERPGHSRHRLLLSSVSGAVRLSRSLVLELQGQWIKLPRQVAQVSDTYVPSPRLWAVRCSCVVRRAGDDGGGRPSHQRKTSATDDDDDAGVVPLAQEVLEAERGYDLLASSVPLDYSDPSEDTVQRLLPGLSYDKLVVQMKRADRSLQPFREVITTSAAVAAAQEEEEAVMSDETGDLLDHVFGPTGVAHNAYISDASHKVAVVHFVFGDAYTTRTVLNVTCAAVMPGAGGADGAAAMRPMARQHDEYSPTPLRPNGKAASHAHAAAVSPAPPASVQVVCDSLTRTSTLYSFLPEETVVRLFPGVSHRRYPPELTWYHGNLAIEASTEQQRRDEAQAAWQRGLTEQSLGNHQRPGPLVVSAVTHHPYESLPLVVEASLTRCLEGRALFVFGGVSTTTGVASARAFVLDVPSQKWVALKSRRGSHDGMPLPRYGHSAAYNAADGAVYVFGGRGRHDGAAAEMEPAADNAVYSDVWRLEWNTAAATVTCTELPCTWAEAPSFATSSSLVPMGNEAAHLARWRHAAVLHDDYLVVVGGQSRSGACCSCSELLYLDIKLHEWCVRRSFGADAPSPRYGHVAAVSDATSLYVFGGWTVPQVGNAVALSAQKASPKVVASVSKSDSLSSSSSGSSSDTDATPQRPSPENSAGNTASTKAVAMADFYKMDLITRMWTRVEPNGALRPPALELADMTACKLDGCPVLVLVGGRPAESTSAASTPRKANTSDLDDGYEAASAQLGVYLFSTATLFWRRVAMDCTPVPTRFGLRAVISSVAASKHPNNNAAAADGSVHADSTRVRRSLPARGHRIGDVVVVGGLPLDETAVVETSPAITLVLAADSGAARGQTSRSASAGAHRSPSARQQPQTLPTPRLPSVPRGAAHAAPRRPATGPPRPPPAHRPTPPTQPRRRTAQPPPVLAWTQQQQQRRSGDSEDDLVEAPPIAVSARSPLAIRKSVSRLHSAGTQRQRSTAGTTHSTSPRAASAGIPFNPERPSCYSTLTPRQQRQLVRRLYTNDLQTRAARLEMLEEQVQQERTTPIFPPSRSRSRSPAAHGAAQRPPRITSAPFQRPNYDTSLNATPIPRNGAASDGSSTPATLHAVSDGKLAGLEAPTAHRDLRSAFLSRSSSSSSSNLSLTTTTSSKQSSERSPSATSSSHASSANSVDDSHDEHHSSFAESTEQDDQQRSAASSVSQKAPSEKSADEAAKQSASLSEASEHEAAESEPDAGAMEEAEAEKAVDDRYDEDSFASSSSSSSSSAPSSAAHGAAESAAEAAQPAAVFPAPEPFPIPDAHLHEADRSNRSDNDDEEESRSAPLAAGNSFSKTSSLDPLVATRAGHTAVSNVFTPAESRTSEASSAAAYLAAARIPAPEIDEGEKEGDEDAAPAEAPSTPRSPDSSLENVDLKETAKTRQPDDEAATPEEGEKAPDESVVEAAPVLPIASDEDTFEKESDSDFEADSDDDVAAAEQKPADEKEERKASDEADADAESASPFIPAASDESKSSEESDNAIVPPAAESRASSEAASESPAPADDADTPVVAAHESDMEKVSEDEEEEKEEEVPHAEEKKEEAEDDYGAEDDDWETFSDEGEKKAASELANTPSNKELSHEEDKAAEDVKDEEENTGDNDDGDDEDDAGLVPPPAPREHQTPPDSSVSSSLPSAPHILDESDDSDKEGSLSDIKSASEEAEKDEEEKAVAQHPAEIPDSSATSSADIAPAAMPIPETDSEADAEAPVRPRSPTDSDAPSSSSSAASHVGVEEQDEEKEAALPRAAPAAASHTSSEAYDDDFSEASEDKESPAARVEPASDSEKSQQSVSHHDVDDDAPHTPTTAESSGVQEQSPAEMEEEEEAEEEPLPLSPPTPASLIAAQDEAKEEQQKERAVVEDSAAAEEKAAPRSPLPSSSSSSSDAYKDDFSDNADDEKAEGKEDEVKSPSTPAASIPSVAERSVEVAPEMPPSFAKDEDNSDEENAEAALHAAHSSGSDAQDELSSEASSDAAPAAPVAVAAADAAPLSESESEDAAARDAEELPAEHPPTPSQASEEEKEEAEEETHAEKATAEVEAEDDAHSEKAPSVQESDAADNEEAHAEVASTGSSKAEEVPPDADDEKVSDAMELSADGDKTIDDGEAQHDDNGEDVVHDHDDSAGLGAALPSSSAASSAHDLPHASAADDLTADAEATPAVSPPPPATPDSDHDDGEADGEDDGNGGNAADEVSAHPVEEAEEVRLPSPPSETHSAAPADEVHLAAHAMTPPPESDNSSNSEEDGEAEEEEEEEEETPQAAADASAVQDTVESSLDAPAAGSEEDTPLPPAASRDAVDASAASTAASSPHDPPVADSPAELSDVDEPQLQVDAPAVASSAPPSEPASTPPASEHEAEDEVNTPVAEKAESDAGEGAENRGDDDGDEDLAADADVHLVRSAEAQHPEADISPSPTPSEHDEAAAPPADHAEESSLNEEAQQPAAHPPAMEEDSDEWGDLPSTADAESADAAVPLAEAAAPVDAPAEADAEDALPPKPEKMETSEDNHHDAEDAPHGVNESDVHEASDAEEEEEKKHPQPSLHELSDAPEHPGDDARSVASADSSPSELSAAATPASEAALPPTPPPQEAAAASLDEASAAREESSADSVELPGAAAAEESDSDEDDAAAEAELPGDKSEDAAHAAPSLPAASVSPAAPDAAAPAADTPAPRSALSSSPPSSPLSLSNAADTAAEEEEEDHLDTPASNVEDAAEEEEVHDQQPAADTLAEPDVAAAVAPMDQWEELASPSHLSARPTSEENPFAPPSPDIDDPIDSIATSGNSSNEEQEEAAAAADLTPAELRSSSEMSAHEQEVPQPMPAAEAADADERSSLPSASSPSADGSSAKNPFAADVAEASNAAEGEEMDEKSASEPEAGDAWEEMSDPPADASSDNPFAPLAAAPSAPLSEAEAEELDEAVVAGEEVSTPASSPPQPPVELASDSGEKPNADAEEKEEDAGAELDDGRDLLDRRRGVEEEVQDDDFDF